MSVEIVEILRRASQGMTRPFICKGDNGNIYFVKGIAAGRRGQTYEWICAHLGQAFGLPVAPFSIVNIPNELADAGGPLELHELGAGPAFGSLEQRITEVSLSQAQAVPVAMQQDLMIFDRWIRNSDRTLTQFGGNPNLFWEPARKELVVIDHNLAFDSEFSKDESANLHVFSSTANELSHDFYRRDEYNARFEKALKCLPEAIASIPQEWKTIDPEQTIPVDFDIEEVIETLYDFRNDSFWTHP